ncbi:tyrosine-type recombinase/integrase [Microbulbifer pacificus]|uniref:Site-specific integrase n=1 Tax=Microbulbifer pacificus TaxID=407164 RepID=A0AAU0N247_9GAMM|nr:site-specific integrase [Microbulbifer pacificus]WOX07032.1 site-specific integrase [Microbulbifer pacificus]
MTRQGYSSNTIEQYSGHIARFINYIYEAALHIPKASPEIIEQAIYSYRDYLLFGVDSSDWLARRVAIELKPKKTTSQRSLIPIGAAISYFLTLSDASAIANGIPPLLPRVTQPTFKHLSPYEKNRIKQSSMLSGVIRNGTKFTKKSDGLFRVPRGNRAAINARDPFPFDRARDLIVQTRSLRDRAFFSLLAASGCRQHEALQIRICDVDFNDFSVKLINPFSRKNTGLEQSEYEKLAWKGRATDQTFLIEPFKTLFFENLSKYLKRERNPYCRHDFIFQKDNGRPYFTSSRQSRAETFSRIKNEIGLGGKSNISVHSLRHMYGTYTLNYIPIGDDLGLNESIVRLLMGHSCITSTRLYARKDTDQIRSAIEYSNQLVSEHASRLSLSEIRINYHKMEIKRLLDLDSER